MARNAHSSMLGLVSSLGYVILWHLTGATVLTAFICKAVFLNLGQLVTSPMTNFTRAKVTLSEHDKQASHKMASEDAVDFINRVDT